MSPFPSSSKAQPALRDKAALAAQVEEDLKIKNEGYTKQSWARFQEALAHGPGRSSTMTLRLSKRSKLLCCGSTKPAPALQKIEGTMTEKEQLEQALSPCAEHPKRTLYRRQLERVSSRRLRDAKAVLADPDSDAQDYENALRARCKDAIAALRVQQPDDARRYGYGSAAEHMALDQRHGRSRRALHDPEEAQKSIDRSCRDPLQAKRSGACRSFAYSFLRRADSSASLQSVN